MKLHLVVKRCFLHGGLVFGLDRCYWVVVGSMRTDLRLLCIPFHGYQSGRFSVLEKGEGTVPECDHSR